MTRNLEVLVGGFGFGEGPRWHAGRLWFSDIAFRRVCAVDLDGKLEVVTEVEGRPSGLGWLPDGRLLVVSMEDHRLLRLDPEGLALVADVSEYCGGFLNDMVVDAQGRAYIGNIGFDIEVRPIQVRSTHIVRIDPDGSARSVASEVMSPNGMVITPDGRRLIAAESAAMRLAAFDIAKDGSLSNRRVFAPMPSGGVTPDGICLDVETAVWVASPTTREFLRVREGGEIAERISTGERAAIACMLGGPGRRTLFCVTSPSMSFHEAGKLRDGRIETVQVEAPGAGLP